jgi:hypothetical protein
MSALKFKPIENFQLRNEQAAQQVIRTAEIFFARYKQTIAEERELLI